MRVVNLIQVHPSIMLPTLQQVVSQGDGPSRQHTQGEGIFI